MVQTIHTVMIPTGQKKIIIEKPSVLHRIFFSVQVITAATTWYDVRMSFDDPLFSSSYSLTGMKKYFEAEGVDIFQGNIWVDNASTASIWYSATEILSQQ